MKRQLLVLGLLGGATIASVRLYRSSDGTIKDGADRTADVVRQRGPAMVQGVAQGIEKLGDATETGAQRIRHRMHAQGGGETDPLHL
jgi:hypothetical protein